MIVRKGLIFSEISDVQNILSRSEQSKYLEEIFRKYSEKIEVSPFLNKSELADIIVPKNMLTAITEVFIHARLLNSKPNKSTKQKAQEILEECGLGDAVLSASDKDAVWRFNTLVDHSYFMGSYYLVGVPIETVSNLSLGVHLYSMSSDSMLPEARHVVYEEMLEDLGEEIEDSTFLYGKGISKTYEQYCFIFMWNLDTGQFEAVYNGFPSTLLEGPLGLASYDCSLCDHFELTKRDIPDFFYDADNNLYCPSCANKISKVRAIHHVGE